MKTTLRSIAKFLLLSAAMGASALSQAGTITFTGIQTWYQEPVSGGWNVWMHSLDIFAFKVKSTGYIDVSVTPASYTPIASYHLEPFAAYEGYAFGKGRKVDGFDFVGQEYINRGNYIMSFGFSYGPFNLDDAFVDRARRINVDSPVPFKSIPFLITMTGDVAVPEPGMVLLMLSGLFGLATTAVKKQRA